jgi:hypothetical protein
MSLGIPPRFLAGSNVLCSKFTEGFVESAFALATFAAALSAVGVAEAEEIPRLLSEETGFEEERDDEPPTESTPMGYLRGVRNRVKYADIIENLPREVLHRMRK